MNENDRTAPASEPMTDDRVTQIVRAATLGKAIRLADIVRVSDLDPQRKEEFRQAIGTVWMRGVRELAREVRRLRTELDAFWDAGRLADLDGAVRDHLMPVVDWQTDDGAAPDWLVRAVMELLVPVAETRDAAHHELSEVVPERDRLAEQVKRVRARHQGVCSGACGLDDACECEDRDLVCEECNERWPCGTIRDLDRTEATS